MFVQVLVQNPFISTTKTQNTTNSQTFMPPQLSSMEISGLQLSTIFKHKNLLVHHLLISFVRRSILEMYLNLHKSQKLLASVEKIGKK
jgi:hypothetical protein